MNSKSSKYLRTKLKYKTIKYFEFVFYIYESFRTFFLLRSNNEIVLVYSIGKVGSSTIYKTLQKNLYLPVFHIHFINGDNIKLQIEYYKKSKRKSAPFHLIRSKVISKYLTSFEGKINIITLIREPISREWSSVFQDILIFQDTMKKDETNMQEIVKVVSEKLNVLANKLPEDTWFSGELEKIFGIDIYSMNFKPDVGYLFFEKDNIKFLLLRLEDLNRVYKEALSRMFVDVDFKLVKENSSVCKFYKDAYSQSQKLIKLDEEKLLRITSSDFYKKFYPDFTRK